jgi:hypothetical protein
VSSQVARSLAKKALKIPGFFYEDFNKKSALNQDGFLLGSGAWIPGLFCKDLNKKSALNQDGFLLGSGAWIRTKDLRVMSGKPGSATSDLQARLFDLARRRVVLASLTGRDGLIGE